MSNVLTFRPRPVAPVAAPLFPAAVRAQIEEAAQAALDTADALLGILDRMDGDTDRGDGGDAEPSLAAPENHDGSQVVWLLRNDADREVDAPEALLPVVAMRPAEPSGRLFPWSGSGNVITAAGTALLGMVAGR